MGGIMQPSKSTNLLMRSKFQTDITKEAKYLYENIKAKYRISTLKETLSVSPKYIQEQI